MSLIGAALYSFPSLSQEPATQPLVEQYAAAFSRGDLGEAEALARRAVDTASGVPEARAGVYRDLAVILLASQQNPRAVIALTEGLAILENRSTDESAEIRRALRIELVRAYKRLGQFEQARVTYDALLNEEEGNNLRSPVHTSPFFVLSSAVPILDHAYAFFSSEEDYAERAGLYSYVLLRRSADRQAANIELVSEFMLDGTASAQRVKLITTDNSYVNVILLPVRNERIDDAYALAGEPGTQIDRARALVGAFYDAAYASDLRVRFCISVETRPMPCAPDTPGPLVIVLEKPIEAFDGTRDAYLMADLSDYESVAIRNVASVLREVIAAEGEQSFGQHVQWLRGRLLSSVFEAADSFHYSAPLQ